MNFLQMANAFISKAGISGGDLASVTGQRGESARVVGWISEAWRNIQELRPNWLWMLADVSFATVAGKGAYTPAECGLSDFASWEEDSFRVYRTGVGVGSEIFLGCMEYERFRDAYLYNNIRNTTGQPSCVAVAPNKSLLLGLAPDAQGYSVAGQYRRAPSELLANTDIPLMPERFHMLIVYEALQSYAAYEAAGEVMAEALRQYRRMKKSLEHDQLPPLTIGGFD